MQVQTHAGAPLQNCTFVPQGQQPVHQTRRGRCLQRQAAAPTVAAGDDWRQKDPKDVRVLVVGPTGYIGKFVTRELVKRGYNTVALARERSGIKGKSSPEDTRKVLQTSQLLLLTYSY